MLKRLALLILGIGFNLPAWAVIEIPLYEKGSDVFYLSGSIAGLGDTEFMLDTGAGYTAISDKTLRVLRDSTEVEYQRTLNSRLANGWISKVEIYRIGRIELGDNCVLENVEAAVVPGLSRNILGLNALRQTGGFSVSFAPLALSVDHCH